MKNLIESELRYRRLFESAQDGILILDAETGMIEDVNPYLIEMLGYSRKEFIKRKLWEFGAFKDNKASKEAFEYLQKNKYIRYEDLPLKTKDGRLIQVEFVSNVYLLASKKVIQCNIRNITDRVEAEKKIKQQIEHLTALRAIDRVIAANVDLELSLSEILMHVTIELKVDAADIMLLNPNSQILEFGAHYGFRSESIRNTRVRMGEGYAGRAGLEKQIIQIQNLKDEPDTSFLTTLLKEENFICYFGVPLIVKGLVKGVLEILNRTTLKPNDEWFNFLTALAGQASIAIENATLFDSLQHSNLELTLAYDATIEGWSRALDLRDKETEGHSKRVAELTTTLGHAYGLSEPELVQVRWGALLHDIGKMGVPDQILTKPGPLTDEEMAIMRRHPTLAHELLAPIRYLRLALDIPYCHHEKWDGSGYPNGTKGEFIPLSARIFSIVDVWDAVNSNRPYRAAFLPEEAVELIRSGSGAHFDPHVVDVFMQIQK